MAIARPRTTRTLSDEDFETERYNLGLSALPGALVGAALGTIFIMLARGLTFSTLENIAIMALILVVPAVILGVTSHFVGLSLLRNEAPSSRSQIFGGNTLMLTLLHGGVWTMIFGAGFGLIISSNPDEVIKLKEKLVVFAPIRPSEPPPITTIPSSPSAGGGGGYAGGSAAEAGTLEDPTGMRSSPSRYAMSGKKMSPAEHRAYMVEQKKRDEQVVDSLKSSGFKVQGEVEYTEPRKP